MKQYQDELGDKLERVTTRNDVDEIMHSFETVLEKKILGIEKTLEWVGERKELQSNNIGAIGISFGSIILATYLGIDDGQRIQAAVLVLAGGNIPDIVANSNEPGIKKMREPLLEKLDEDKEWLKARLQGKSSWDPIESAKHFTNPDFITMYLAKNDTFVPEKNGLELAEALGTDNLTILKRGPLNLLGGILRRIPFFPKKISENFDPISSARSQKESK